MATTQELARDMSQAFERATRPDGGEFTRLRDGSPEWMRDVVMDAHCEMMPDDWRYAAVAAATEFIADADDPEDAAGEFADGAVDVYTSALTDWLGSNAYRPAYVDDAANEFGAAEDVLQSLQRGQYMEAHEVYNAPLAALQARADDGEEN